MYMYRRQGGGDQLSQFIAAMQSAGVEGAGAQVAWTAREGGSNRKSYHEKLSQFRRGFSLKLFCLKS